MKVAKSYLKKIILEELSIVLMEMEDEENSEDSYENEPEPPNWLQQAAEEEQSDEEYDTFGLDHTAQMYAAGKKELEDDEESEEERLDESIRDWLFGAGLALGGLNSGEAAAETPSYDQIEVASEQPSLDFDNIVVMYHKDLKHQDARMDFVQNAVDKIEHNSELATGKEIVMGNKELRRYFAQNINSVDNIQKFLNTHNITQISEYIDDPIIIIKGTSFNMAYKGMLLVKGGSLAQLTNIQDLISNNISNDVGLNEGLEYHKKAKIPLTENIYRIGSDAYFQLIKEARVHYKKGNYTPLNEEEKEMLESDLGEWATFRGERVPLDFPMYEETIEEAKKKKKKKKKDPPIGKPMKNTGAGKKYKVYVRSASGRIKKISYGDAKGGLKGNWNSAEARKNFASRHNCAEKKDRTKAGYWACRAHKDFGTNVPGRFW